MKRTIVIGLVLMLVLLTVAPALAQGGPGTYQVRRGDTWTAVSTRLGVPMCALARANGHRRCSSIYRASSRLMVGQTLEVPGAY